MNKENFNKLWYISKEVKTSNIYFVLIINILKPLFETLSIGLFYPFLSLILDTSILESNTIFNWAIANQFVSNKESFIFYFGFGIIIIFIVSGLISIYAKYKFDSLVWELNTNTVKLSFKKYINESLISFKRLNTNEITHNIINEVHVFINGFIVNFIDLIPRVLIVIFFFIYLTILNPLVTLISGLVLFFLYGVILKYLRKRVNLMSEDRYKFQKQIQDYVNTSIRAIKDIRINSFEDYFVNKVLVPTSKYSELHRKISIYSIVPKYFIETLLLVSLTFYALYTFDEESLKTQIPMLSVLGLSLFKLVPHIQGIYNNYTRMIYNLPSIEIIYNNIKELENIEEKSLVEKVKFEKLSVKNINFSYNEKNVLNNVSLVLNEGDFCLLYGESGTGKSTLIEIILGFLKPDSGEIVYNSNQQLDYKLLSNKLSLGYVSQDIILFEGDLIENISMKEKGEDENLGQLDKLIEICQLNDIIKSLGGLHGFISEGGKNLSAGQKQRIILARALYRNPDLIILDEATSALNKNLEEKILLNLVKEGKTILMITHNEALKKLTPKVISL